MGPEDGGREGVEGLGGEARVGRPWVEGCDVVEDGESARGRCLGLVAGGASVVLNAVAGGYALEGEACGRGR